MQTAKKSTAWTTYSVNVRVGEIWADFYVKARNEAEAQRKGLTAAKRSPVFPSHLHGWLRAIV